MRLTLVRHAIAADGEDDFKRPLTDEGRWRFERSVKRLKKMKVRFTRVLQSPKVRAVQTAELMTPLIDGPVVTSDLLMKAPSEKLLELLAHDGIAAVGHEPHLTSLLAWLVMGNANEHSRFELKKGGVARLEGQVEPGGMKLTALWTPKSLRE